MITQAGESVTPRLCDTERERRFMHQPEGVRRQQRVYQLHPCWVLDSQKVTQKRKPQLLFIL